MHTQFQESQGRLGAQSPPPLPTPVKSHSCTPKIHTIFSLMLSRATKGVSLAGCNDGPLLWYFDPLSPINYKGIEIYKKNVVRVKLSGSASTKRERERESEPAHGAHETFSHNLTFYVNQYCTKS